MSILNSIRQRLPGSLDSAGRFRISNDLAPAQGYSDEITLTSANAWQSIKAESTPIKSGVWIQAAQANTGLIKVRFTGQTSGPELAKGETIFITIDNLTKLQVLATTANDKALYAGS